MANQVVRPGDIIEGFRRDRGWNRTELARACKLSASQVAKLEQGYENLKCSTLNKIALALSIKPCVFLMVHDDCELFDQAVGVRWAGGHVVEPHAIIRELCTDKGLSHAELARKSKMGPPQMSKIVNGKCYLTYQTLVRIARVLDIKPCVFLMDLHDRETFSDLVGMKW